MRVVCDEVSFDIEMISGDTPESSGKIQITVTNFAEKKTLNVVVSTIDGLRLGQAILKTSFPMISRMQIAASPKPYTAKSEGSEPQPQGGA